MILGLTGLKGSGKDTFAAALIANHNFQRFAFADPLKQSAAAALGCTVEHLEKYKNDTSAWVKFVAPWLPSATPTTVSAVTVREYLQRYGVEAHRDIFGSTFWIDHTMRHVLAERGDVVITDARFENEQQAIIDAGGWIIRIDRSRDPIGIEREGWDVPVDDHASEQIEHGLTNIVVPNRGTIADLAMIAHNVVKGIRLGQLSR